MVGWVRCLRVEWRCGTEMFEAYQRLVRERVAIFPFPHVPVTLLFCEIYIHYLIITASVNICFRWAQPC